MDNIRPCTGCGALLPADAPGALCPKCAAQTPALRETMLVTAGAVLPESRTQPVSAESPPPVRLGGYRIIRALGKGGMGAVYEAEEIESGRRVALKVLSQGLDSPEARRRFLREGRLAASVNHPNTVYVFGTDEIDGQPVIIMELVSGGTLQERVKNRPQMAEAEAVDAILQVIAGLEAAAALGVLHRDIKPSNCFVETDGTVKVGDFGLSVSTAVRGETKLTMAGSFLGTPAFSSPEQLRGDEFTIQGDIYAVGVTLYCLLAGRPPFEEDDMVRMLATVLERAPDSPALARPELPRGLCRAVLRCLEKQPAKRFRNYAQLRNALLPYSSAAPSPATLSLRLLAGYIDSTLLNVAFMPVTLLWSKQWVASPQTKSLLFLALGAHTLNVLYFALLEGLWGASLGKRLCRLRVVGPNRALPGVPRALVRALIVGVLPALPGLLVLSFSYPAHPSTSGLLKMGATSNIGYVILALLFSTARRRNGFAAVQDLVTRTRVVRRSSHAARPVLETAQEKPAAPDAAARLGPYHVLETLAKSNHDEMLIGFDTRLLRKVWIRKLPAGTPPLAPALRNLARVGRLRWLNGKHSAEECWDAYEAVTGAPLPNLIYQRQPWSRVRFWLLDLAEELTASLKDQTLPAALQLDRVWITADGRAKLLDFPAPGADAPSPIASGSSSPELFLNQVAVAALEGRPTAAADAQSASVAIPLPLHARELLEELRAGLSPSLLAQRIKPLLHQLAFISRRRRFAMIAGCSIFPLIGSVFLYAGFALAHTKGAQTNLSEVTTLKESLRQWSELQANRDLPGGLDGHGDAYSANLLGPALTWNGRPFHFGPTNAADVVTAIGQTIPLPAGHFTNLSLLATGIEGQQPSQVLTLTYTTNETSTWQQDFSDWFSPLGYPGESNALMMAYRDKGDGTQDHRPFYLYGYTYPLNSNRTLQSITLPRNPVIEILAVTLAPPPTTVDLSSHFNQANGIAADGSHFSLKADKQTVDAFEIYITGRFRQTITNAENFSDVSGAIPRDQVIAAQQLVARRNPPTDSELKQAAAVVEPYLKGSALLGPPMSFKFLLHPMFLFAIFFILGAVPCFLAALFRGGLVLRMLGVAVVKKDGAPASGLRMFWRSFIAWLPLLLVGSLGNVVFLSGDSSSSEAAILGLGYMAVTLCLMLFAALLPERGLHDRLAGTCLVPRE